MSNAKFNIDLPKNEPVKSYAPGSPEKLEFKETLKKMSSQVMDIPLVIDGQKIFSDKKDDVICPHNKSQVIARSSTATKEDVHAAINSCLAARKAWASLPWEERASVFLKAADLIATKYRSKINAATMLGQSKTIFQAEIDAACELIDFFRFNAHFAQKIYESQPISSPGMWNKLSARGLEGFVFAIAPFNFTAISLNLPASPALMGCSVLWKPAPTAVYASYLCLEILEEAGLPKGVINMVTGDAPMIGDIALKHKELSGVHFTGSTATFNHIWKEVGTNIDNYNTYPRIVGETGGKDFVFAHNSANCDELSTALVRGAFEYQGQKCSAASRAYVPKSIWPELKEKLVNTTKSISMGCPSDFTNFMSAVIDQRSFDKIKSFIDDANSSSDAEVIVGGECDDTTGFFVRPTIIEAKKADYKTMVEEIFGPVLTIFVYDDEKFDETLNLCDTSTKYALTGSIFAKDRHTINYMTSALENAAGNFYVNDKPTGAVVGQQPFGGARASGTNDKAGSIYNLLRWVSFRTIKENFYSMTDYKYPFMDEV